MAETADNEGNIYTDPMTSMLQRFLPEKKTPGEDVKPAQNLSKQLGIDDIDQHALPDLYIDENGRQRSRENDRQLEQFNDFTEKFAKGLTEKDVELLKYYYRGEYSGSKPSNAELERIKPLNDIVEEQTKQLPKSKSRFENGQEYIDTYDWGSLLMDKILKKYEKLYPGRRSELTPESPGFYDTLLAHLTALHKATVPNFAQLDPADRGTPKEQVFDILSNAMALIPGGPRTPKFGVELIGTKAIKMGTEPGIPPRAANTNVRATREPSPTPEERALLAESYKALEFQMKEGLPVQSPLIRQKLGEMNPQGYQRLQQFEIAMEAKYGKKMNTWVLDLTQQELKDYKKLYKAVFGPRMNLVKSAEPTPSKVNVGPGRGVLNDNFDEVVKMIKNKASDQEIADRFDITALAVRTWVKRNAHRIYPKE